MKNNKLGISVVSLIVIVIVISIFTAVATISINSIIDDTYKREFMKEYTLVKSATKDYIVRNSGKVDFEETTIDMSLINDNFAYQFENETVNSDNMIEAYIIDLDKVGISNTTYGLNEDGMNEDVYVVTKDTNNVYYKKGFETDDFIYYKAINENKEQKNEEEETETEVDGKELISFTVYALGEEDTLYAEKGWTWSDFVGSEYDKYNFKIDNGEGVYDNAKVWAGDFAPIHYAYSNPDDYIYDGETYSFEPQMVEFFVDFYVEDNNALYGERLVREEGPYVVPFGSTWADFALQNEDLGYSEFDGSIMFVDEEGKWYTGVYSEMLISPVGTKFILEVEE